MNWQKQALTILPSLVQKVLPNSLELKRAIT